MGIYDCLLVPPGGQRFILMDPRECIQTKPQLKETQKPLCLSMVDDATWKNWISKLKKILQSYWNEQILGILYLSFNALYILLILILRPAEWTPRAGIVLLIALVVPIILALLAYVGAQYILVRRNEALDKEIHALCQRLSATSGGRVEYRTACTQFSRGVGVRVCRLVAFLPDNAVVIPGQQIQVIPGASEAQVVA